MHVRLFRGRRDDARVVPSSRCGGKIEEWAGAVNGLESARRFAVDGIMPVCLPDTSCLIHLDRIDRLDLLRALYDDVRIPPAVRHEYGDAPKGIDVASAPEEMLVRLLRRTVDAGEAEVIARATELDNSHAILDDAAARREASELELTVLGTVGLILRAKQAGHISAVRPLLDALQGSGFWMSDALYQHALRRAGEE